MKEIFGQLLARLRKSRGLTQAEIANPELSLSRAYIAMIETGKRGFSPDKPRSKRLAREQVWYLVKKLKLWPPECDDFLKVSGHSSDRTHDEEREIQLYPQVEELWIFARSILDLDRDWYEIVQKNIGRGVMYRYFTANDVIFHTFLEKLKKKFTEDTLVHQIECTLVPEQLLMTNFVIYNPGKSDMYCCGTKIRYGKAECFYTIDRSEAVRLYEILLQLRQRLDNEQTIPLEDFRRMYPDSKRARFVPKH